MRAFLLSTILLVPAAFAAVGAPYPVGVGVNPGHNCLDPALQGVYELQVGVTVVYFVDRGAISGEGFFLYEESNGIYHDANYGDLQRNDVCTNWAPGWDTLII